MIWGNLITGQNITFVIGGIDFENVISVEGYVNMPYNVFSTVGDLLVSGKCAGDGNYGILIINGLLQIRIPTKITINTPTEVKIGNSVIFESISTDEDENFIVGATVNFYVDGKKIAFAITDSNGVAKLNFTFKRFGKSNVVAIFTGDTVHISSNVTNQTSVSDVEDSIDPDIPNPELLDPIDPNNSDILDNSDFSGYNSSIANASMKSIGIPIMAIFLTLFSYIVLICHRKNE